MKFNLRFIYIFVFLFSCTHDMKIIKKISKVSKPTYSSKGFALIYENSIFESKVVNKKLYNNQNYVLHSFLKNNTLVNISNPLNSKSLIAKPTPIVSTPAVHLYTLGSLPLYVVPFLESLLHSKINQSVLFLELEISNFQK